MFAAEVVDGKFRFLKAQGTAKVCLACHGKNISAEVECDCDFFHVKCPFFSKDNDK
jgi:hypothetical protein